MAGAFSMDDSRTSPFLRKLSVPGTVTRGQRNDPELRRKIQKLETDYAVHFMPREVYNEERIKLYTEDEAQEAQIVWPRAQVHSLAGFGEQEFPRSPAGFREYVLNQFSREEPDWRPRIDFHWPFSLMNRDIIKEESLADLKRREEAEARHEAEQAEQVARWRESEAQQEAKRVAKKARREEEKAKREAAFLAAAEAEKLAGMKTEEVRDEEADKVSGKMIEELREGVAEAEKLLDKMKEELRVEIGKREAAKAERGRRRLAELARVYDPKPFQCTKCLKKFTTEGGMLAHTKAKHNLLG